jgi:hypothetical protein
MTEEVKEIRRQSFLFPLILILLGVTFLANNLGLISWDVWNGIWKFWPVSLILLGLQILLKKT